MRAFWCGLVVNLLLWACPGAARAAASAATPAAVAAPRPAAATSDDTPAWAHAFAVYGTPRYAAGFAHYDYVNPDAPKRGTLNLGNPDRRTSFTRLNPYLLKGSGAFGTYFFCFEPLFDASQDEAGVMYGLVAQSMAVAPDLSSILVRIHPKARFNNGDAVTAADVKYSFDAMASDLASPEYSALVRVARRAVVVDDHTVRFDMAVKSRDAIYTLGTTLVVFSPKWGMGPDGKTRPFDKIIGDFPITTGAYTVARNYSGRRLDLVLNPDYWARNEGVRRGFYNFTKIVYRYYEDNAVQLEALKAGDVDLFWETKLKRWGRQFKGARFGPGKIITRALPSGQGTYPRSIVFNLRRDKFKDLRVREALQLSLDFEWLNAQNFNLYARVDSAFSNSDFAARGLPTAGELAILAPFRAQLPAAVFGPPFVNPRTDTSPTALRDNLKRARDLLGQAGWRLGSDRVLRNAKGEAFTLELLNNDADIAVLLEPWLVNLQRLGIQGSFRQIDYAVYAKRLETFDFDMTQINLGEFLMPSPALLKDFYGSAEAAQEGSDNYGGVADPALDAAITAMAQAQTLPQLLDASHAFDRVLMQQRYFIPWLRRPAFNAAWWDRFGMPAKTPRYYTLISDTNNANPWPIWTWWSASDGPRK